MPDAYLVGAGQSDYGTFPEESYRSLFRTAFDAAVENVPKGFETADVDEAFIGTLGVGGRQLGLSGPAVTEHVISTASPVPASRTPARRAASRPARPSRRSNPAWQTSPSRAASRL